MEDGMFYFPNRLSIARLFRESSFFQSHICLNPVLTLGHASNPDRSGQGVVICSVWYGFRFQVPHDLGHSTLLGFCS